MWPVVAKAEEETELASKLYLKKMTHWHSPFDAHGG
jgi:hypothetical protein